MNNSSFSGIPSDVLRNLYRTMLLIRRFEEKIVEVYPQQDMKTPVHLCIGQEAISAGVCANLKKEDYIFSTHRSHGQFLAKGGEPRLLLAECYGRKTGCCSGKGGSMHPASVEYNMLGTTAIVGGGIVLAVGTALASCLRKETKVSVAFSGDGASDEGAFHEGLNFAALKKLPVVFICENNFYATNSHISARQPHDNIAKRSDAYGIEGIQLNGNDVLSVYMAAKVAIEKARMGGGPTLIECRTYRWKGHVGPDCDYEKGCRPKKELEDWMEKCPLKSYQEYLLQHKIMTDTELQCVSDNIDMEIGSALSFAKGSPFPDPCELTKNVYFEKK
jgi:pyruvate dehydrogenase E1 component alpha subunit